MEPDADGYVWFDFDESEAKGRVAVRRDAYGLGIYLEPGDIGQPGIDPVRVASVDLFYKSREWRIGAGVTKIGGDEGLSRKTGIVQMVIDDTVGDDVVALVEYRPKQTVIELQREEDFEFVRPPNLVGGRRPELRLVYSKKEETSG